jgi:hypothetical protein
VASLAQGQMLIGSVSDDGLQPNSGSVFVYNKSSAGQWKESARLVPSDGLYLGQFGSHIATDGQTAIMDGSSMPSPSSHVYTVYFYELD